MASLTETAYYTRRTINWLILATITYFLLRAFWSVLLVAWLTVFPPKPQPPNHAFGKLPAIKFPPPQATPSGQLTFILETIEGAVPPASPSATVYFMPKSPANLLGLTRTQEFAQRLRFNPTPIAETKYIYRFEDPETPLRRLRYDIVSNNFILRYAFDQDAATFALRNIPDAAGSLAEAKNILQVYDLFVPDLIDGKTAVTFLRSSGNQLVATTSQSQADAVRVDFFRRPVDGIPVFTPDPQEGLVSLVFSGATNTNKRVLQFAYTFWPIDYDTRATYSLKTSSQAWEELKTRKGHIARYPATGSVATVRNVHLGYYDTFEPQTYLQPLFIFEGDGGFLGYVPAVAPEWTE